MRRATLWAIGAALSLLNAAFRKILLRLLVDLLYRHSFLLSRDGEGQQGEGNDRQGGRTREEAVQIHRSVPFGG